MKTLKLIALAAAVLLSTSTMADFSQTPVDTSSIAGYVNSSGATAANGIDFNSEGTSGVVGHLGRNSSIDIQSFSTGSAGGTASLLNGVAAINVGHSDSTTIKGTTNGRGTGSAAGYSASDASAAYNYTSSFTNNSNFDVIEVSPRHQQY